MIEPPHIDSSRWTGLPADFQKGFRTSRRAKSRWDRLTPFGKAWCALVLLFGFVVYPAEVVSDLATQDWQIAGPPFPIAYAIGCFVAVVAARRRPPEASFRPSG